MLQYHAITSHVQSRLEAEDQGEELLVGELDPPIPVGVKLLEGVS